MCSVGEIVARLGQDEKACLERLAGAPGRKLPAPQAADQLIRLGLAEVVMGELDLTGTGRRALLALRA